jgi:hypothetical protein
MKAKKALRLLATDLFIFDKNGNGHTDKMIRRAGMALQESAIFRVLVFGERETRGETKKPRRVSKLKQQPGKFLE